MANYHYCKVAAVGNEDEMKQMLKTMVGNYNKAFNANKEPRDSIKELENQINELCDGYDFLMEMICPDAEGCLYAEYSYFSVDCIKNGWYVAVFTYEDRWVFHPSDFLSLHSVAGGIQMVSIDCDEDNGGAYSCGQFADGKYSDDYDYRLQIIYALKGLSLGDDADVRSLLEELRDIAKDGLDDFSLDGLYSSDDYESFKEALSCDISDMDEDELTDWIFGVGLYYLFNYQSYRKNRKRLEGIMNDMKLTYPQ